MARSLSDILVATIIGFSLLHLAFALAAAASGNGEPLFSLFVLSVAAALYGASFVRRGGKPFYTAFWAVLGVFLAVGVSDEFRTTNTDFLIFANSVAGAITAALDNSMVEFAFAALSVLALIRSLPPASRT